MKNKIRGLTENEVVKVIAYQEGKLEDVLSIKKDNPEWVEGQEQEIREILSLLYIEERERNLS